MPGMGAIFRLALQFLVNLTDQQREYIKWRLSDDGKKHFDRLEENKFYDALLNGDTDIISLEIANKQRRIDQLKKSLGLAVLICFTTFSGCTPLRIPDGIPNESIGKLKSTELVYAVMDLTVNVPDKGPMTLDGQWYVVSRDFMLTHTQNQTDLICALEKEKTIHNRFRAGAWIIVSAAGLLLSLKLLRLFKRHK